MEKQKNTRPLNALPPNFPKVKQGAKKGEKAINMLQKLMTYSYKG